METEKTLNAKILEITMQIQKNHPELSKLIDEMPVTVPNESHPDLNIKVLQEYYDSLQNILNKFT